MTNPYEFTPNLQSSPGQPSQRFLQNIFHPWLPDPAVAILFVQLIIFIYYAMNIWVYASWKSHYWKNTAKDRGEERRTYAMAKEAEMQAENNAMLSLICPSLPCFRENQRRQQPGGSTTWKWQRDPDITLQLRLQQRRRMRAFVKLKRKNQNQVSPNAVPTRSSRK